MREQKSLRLPKARHCRVIFASYVDVQYEQTTDAVAGEMLTVYQFMDTRWLVTCPETTMAGMTLVVPPSRRSVTRYWPGGSGTCTTGEGPRFRPLATTASQNGVHTIVR